MQSSIELEALVVCNLLVEEVITTDGDDENADERLDRYDDVSCALGILQPYVGRDDAFYWYLFNIIIKRVCNTKERFCSYDSMSTKLIVAVNTGCVMDMEGGNDIRMVVGIVCVMVRVLVVMVQV